MKPEQLKVIAEGMGYKIQNIDPSSVYVKHAGFTVYGFPYNPLTNNDQMVEVMEKLSRHGILEIDSNIKGECFVTYDSHDYSGKTINEAVCNAAYDYFKQYRRVI